MAACAPLTLPPAPPLPRPTLSTVEFQHAVQFPTGRAELTPLEAAGLQRFAAALPSGRRLDARVVGHADVRGTGEANLRLSSRRAEAVAEILRAAGVGGIATVTQALGDPPGLAGERRVDVLITSREVVLPGCPDWSREPGFDPNNLPLSNLGCANAVNLGLMVADPGDLATGRPLAPADGSQQAEAIARYRADKVKQLEAEIIQ